MAGESVTFVLDDGETLPVPDENLRRVYDLLWDLRKEPGAVSTAALIMDAQRLDPFARRPIALTTPQSVVLRKAVSLIQP
jgi:hypothetical protein